MGVIHVTVAIRDSKKSRKKYEALFLVDTGATDSMLTGDEFKKAEIKA